jgi:hypothetical protein
MEHSNQQAARRAKTPPQMNKSQSTELQVKECAA